MAVKTPATDIICEIKDKPFLPIYLVEGEDGYQIDQVSEFFEHNVVPEENRDFDQRIVYGRDTTVAAVIDLAMQYPMLSEKRLVMVKEAQDLEPRGNAWEKFVAYLNNASSTTVIVLCYRHKSLDKRSKAHQAISKKGKVYEFKKLGDSAVKKWIGGYVRDKGYSITEEMAMLIADTVGNDLSKIACELDKVFITLPKGEVINSAVVEKYIGISKDYNVFELQNAIGTRNVVKCNKIVNYAAANPKDMPLQMVLAILYRYFINIMICHQEPASLKCSPFVLDGYRDAASRYPLPKLAACIGYLHDADLRSKGVRNNGTISESELLKELVFKLIH